eukprot:gnl/Chilomastix_cuspidata/1637.p1 GENE.gnl/Chilomastix_cuspidata/1637~~gnl/Chilomastix_cuspidata/1637.p1  ORF type:complete len:452 (-),score=110.96 gnl/Chilomastix_cuspidata/1637:990-2345(-)
MPSQQSKPSSIPPHVVTCQETSRVRDMILQLAPAIEPVSSGFDSLFFCYGLPKQQSSDLFTQALELIFAKISPISSTSPTQALGINLRILEFWRGSVYTLTPDGPQEVPSTRVSSIALAKKVEPIFVRTPTECAAVVADLRRHTTSPCAHVLLLAEVEGRFVHSRRSPARRLCGTLAVAELFDPLGHATQDGTEEDRDEAAMSARSVRSIVAAAAEGHAASVIVKACPLARMLESAICGGACVAAALNEPTPSDFIAYLGALRPEPVRNARKIEKKEEMQMSIQAAQVASAVLRDRIPTAARMLEEEDASADQARAACARAATSIDTAHARIAELRAERERLASATKTEQARTAEIQADLKTRSKTFSADVVRNCANVEQEVAEADVRLAEIRRATGAFDEERAQIKHTLREFMKARAQHEKDAAAARELIAQHERKLEQLRGGATPRAPK